FTRKPLLETVKGFFRLDTSMAITLPPLHFLSFYYHSYFYEILANLVVIALYYDESKTGIGFWFFNRVLFEE
uniref:hypothetical protein n=1 Tax=Sphingobacterium sp. TaxID=341027 RepID=UPI002FDB2E3B